MLQFNSWKLVSVASISGSLTVLLGVRPHTATQARPRLRTNPTNAFYKSPSPTYLSYHFYKVHTSTIYQRVLQVALSHLSIYQHFYKVHTLAEQKSCHSTYQCKLRNIPAYLPANQRSRNTSTCLIVSYCCRSQGWHKLVWNLNDVKQMKPHLLWKDCFHPVAICTAVQMEGLRIN